MTQHKELIERLRTCEGDPMSMDWAYTDKQTLRAAMAAIEGLERENEALRKDAERYRFLRNCDLDDMAAKYWPNAEVPTDEVFDAAIDAAKGAEDVKKS